MSARPIVPFDNGILITAMQTASIPAFSLTAQEGSTRKSLNVALPLLGGCISFMALIMGAAELVGRDDKTDRQKLVIGTIEVVVGSLYLVGLFCYCVYQSEACRNWASELCPSHSNSGYVSIDADLSL